MVDSGATGTFMPLELTQVLNMTLPTNTNNAVGAGGVFHTYNMKIDCIEVIKGGETFCDLANFSPHIDPTRRNTAHGAR